LGGVSRWISDAIRTVSESVPAAPAAVRAFYTDLDSIKLVHPLVVSVRSVARRELAGGYQETYRIQDRIPVGVLTLPISYTATLSVPAEGDVLADSRQFPGVRLHTVVSFEPLDLGTRVVERMAIRAPRPLAGITVRQAVAAHAEMLAGIRRHFE
jgi:hypothetical protein